MAKSNAIEKAGAGGVLATVTPEVPDYLKKRDAGTEVRGLELVTGEMEAMPNLKIIQGMSAEELKDQFGEGGVILTPLGIPIAAKGDPFFFVPIFFYPSWEKWSDVNDNDLPMVLDQSLSKSSTLANMARNPKTREQPYEPGSRLMYSYMEVLNFFVYIQTAGAIEAGGPGHYAIMRLSGGEHYTGRRINSLARSRARQYRADLWNNRFEADVTLRQPGGNRKWYGPNPRDPGNPALWFVSSEQAAEFEKMNADFQAQYEQGLLVVAADPDQGTSVDGSTIEGDDGPQVTTDSVGPGDDETPI
jgi:hypothetical protein